MLAKKAAVIDPFAKLDYDKVVAYEYQPKEEEPIIHEGKLAKKIYATTVLTKEQVKSWNKIITDTATYGGETASCFQPHMGVVYYKGDKVVAHVSVCMACNFLQCSENVVIPAEHYFFYDYDGEHTPAIGFSRWGRKKLRTFTDQLNFKNNFHKARCLYDE